MPKFEIDPVMNNTVTLHNAELTVTPKHLHVFWEHDNPEDIVRIAQLIVAASGYKANRANIGSGHDYIIENRKPAITYLFLCTCKVCQNRRANSILKALHLDKEIKP